jgi:hypothetical protein
MFITQMFETTVTKRRGHHQVTDALLLTWNRTQTPKLWHSLRNHSIPNASQMYSLRNWPQMSYTDLSHPLKPTRASATQSTTCITSAKILLIYSQQMYISHHSASSVSLFFQSLDLPSSYLPTLMDLLCSFCLPPSNPFFLLTTPPSS